jgi:hypothetical protein
VDSSPSPESFRRMLAEFDEPAGSIRAVTRPYSGVSAVASSNGETYHSFPQRLSNLVRRDPRQA